jgi:hypothetical protein
MGRPAVTGDVGPGNGQHLPLEPSTEADLEALYLPVDQTKEEFDRFKEHLAGVERLGEQGWLVVVTGDSGCGKTSMVKRCALWLELKLQEQYLSPVKVDLTGENLVHEDIKTRLRRVFGSVLRHMRGGLDSTTVTLLRDLGKSERDGDLDDAFEWLADELLAVPADAAKRPVAIVLLPTCPTAKEVLRYAAIARQGLIFFAEVADPQEARQCDAELRDQRNSRFLALHLKVGKLKPGDGRLFANNVNLRHSETTSTASFPRMTDEVIDTHLEAMIKDPGMSILRLRRLASGACREAVRRGGATIEVVDVANYHYRLARDGELM